MAFQFDNRISWMDIVALIGVILTGSAMIFGLGADIEQNTNEINHNKEAIARVEKQGERRVDKVVEEVKEYRKEQKQAFDKLDGKLDKLIQRELDRH